MAAYEEAIFRVYDRSLEGVRQDNEEIDDGSISRKTCQTLEMILLGGTAVVSLFTIVLHCAVVGKAGCLPDLLHERMVIENRSSLLPEDGILQINVPDRFYDSDDPFNPNGDVFEHSDDDITMEDRRRRRLLRWEELDTVMKFKEQVRKYNSLGAQKFKKTEEWLRYRQPIVLKLVGYFKEMLGAKTVHSDAGTSPKLGHQTAPANTQQQLWYENSRGRLLDYEKGTGGNSGTLAKNVTSAVGNGTHDDEYDGFDPRYFKKHDFEYCADIGILSLSNKIRAKHNFTLVEVSLDGEQCFGNGFVQSLIPFGSIDNVILNNVMYTLHKKGILVSSRNDYYDWHEEVLHPYSNAGTWLGFKLTVAIKTIFSYFLLSCSTALLIRILISSGVALVFPIFYLLDYTGVYAFTDQHLRLISHAYPWLGIPMEMLSARQESPVPFFTAHISRVILFYTLYEALQFAISIWFYADNQPGEKELWLFALMMLWEYYSLVYVRTYSTIVLFPRATFAAFALYHIYLYSYPGGYHFLALFIIFLLTVWLMLFCIRKYEHDAYQRGVVNADQPRQLYNHLPYPTWTQALAPEYTLFQPPSRRSTSVYAEPVGGYAENNNTSSVESVDGSARDGNGETPLTDSTRSGSANDNPTEGSVEMSSASAWSSLLGIQPSNPSSTYEQLESNSSHHREREGQTRSQPMSSS